MDNTLLFNGGKPLSVRESLVYWANNFRDRMVAALIDLRHFEAIAEVRPDYQDITPDGRKVKVATIVAAKKDGVRYAREHVRRITAMLESIEGKTEAECLEILSEGIGAGAVESPFKGEAKE
jgi:hypothetical protein